MTSVFCAGQYTISSSVYVELWSSEDYMLNITLLEVLYTQKTTYIHVSKSFRTESITKNTLTTINTRWEATQKVMAAKLTRMTHKIAIQLQLVAESCAIYSSRSRRPVRQLLDTPSYFEICCFPDDWVWWSSLGLSLTRLIARENFIIPSCFVISCLSKSYLLTEHHAMKAYWGVEV
jgi:hypothetical protein